MSFDGKTRVKQQFMATMQAAVDGRCEADDYDGQQLTQMIHDHVLGKTDSLGFLDDCILTIERAKKKQEVREKEREREMGRERGRGRGRENQRDKKNDVAESELFGKQLCHRGESTAEMVEKINKSFKSKYRFDSEAEEIPEKPRVSFRDGVALISSKIQAKKTSTKKKLISLGKEYHSIVEDTFIDQGENEDSGSKFRRLFQIADQPAGNLRRTVPVIELNSDGSVKKQQRNESPIHSLEQNRLDFTRCPLNTPAQESIIQSDDEFIKINKVLQAANALGKRKVAPSIKAIDQVPTKITPFGCELQKNKSITTVASTYLEEELRNKVSQLETNLAHFRFKSMTYSEIKVSGSVNCLQFENTGSENRASFSLSCSKDPSSSPQAMANMLMRIPIKDQDKTRSIKFGYISGEEASQPVPHRYFEDLNDIVILDFDISYFDNRCVYTVAVSRNMHVAKPVDTRHAQNKFNSRIIRLSVDDKGDRCMTKGRSQPKTVISDRQYQAATDSTTISVDCDVMARSKIIAIDRLAGYAYYVAVVDGCLESSDACEQILKVDLKVDTKDESGKFFVEKTVLTDRDFLKDSKIQQLIISNQGQIFFITNESLMSYNEKTGAKQRHFLNGLLSQLTQYENHLYVIQKGLATQSKSCRDDNLNIHIFDSTDMAWKYKLKFCDGASTLANTITFRIFKEYERQYIIFASLGLISKGHAQSFLSVYQLQNNRTEKIADYQLGEVTAARAILDSDQFPQIHGLELKHTEGFDTSIALFGVNKIAIFSRH